MRGSRGPRAAHAPRVLRSVVLLTQLGTASWASAQQDLSGSIGAATDYIYRGVSQTNGDPAVQGGLLLQLAPGWRAGVWSSTVDMNRDERSGYQVDLHATRSWLWGEDWSAALGVTHREYLGERGAVDYDHDELSAALSFQGRATASVAWSPNASIYWRGPTRGRAVTYELTLQQPLGARWSLFAGAGRYDLDDLVGDAYEYWSAGVTFTWTALQLDVACIGADRTAQSVFRDRSVRRRWTGALSVRF